MAPLKFGIPNEAVRAQLEDWRDRVWRRDFGDALFVSSSILTDKTIENLASVGPIPRLIDLERVVGCQWPWFGQYGNELLTELLGMSIPPARPKPTRARGTKRPGNEEVAMGAKPDVTVNGGQSYKRSRVAPRNPASNREKVLTAVNDSPSLDRSTTVHPDRAQHQFSVSATPPSNYMDSASSYLPIPYSVPATPASGSTNPYYLSPQVAQQPPMSMFHYPSYYSHTPTTPTPLPYYYYPSAPTRYSPYHPSDAFSTRPTAS
jgi:hypothetical protein